VAASSTCMHHVGHRRVFCQLILGALQSDIHALFGVLCAVMAASGQHVHLLSHMRLICESFACGKQQGALSENLQWNSVTNFQWNSQQIAVCRWVVACVLEPISCDLPRTLFWICTHDLQWY
jgi:hypothetical protein